MFQRLVDTVLAGVKNSSAYLDMLLLYLSTWSEHVDTLTKVTLNLAKCEFGKGTVTYLGRQVGQGQVRPIEAKVSAITLKASEPSCAMRLSSLLLTFPVLSCWNTMQAR